MQIRARSCNVRTSYLAAEIKTSGKPDGKENSNKDIGKKKK